VCVCASPINAALQCLRDINCVLPNNLRGLIPALTFFCTDEYGRQYTQYTRRCCCPYSIEYIVHVRWLGSRVVNVVDSGTQIAAATLSGNSLTQTVHTRCASVHQAAKFDLDTKLTLTTLTLVYTSVVCSEYPEHADCLARVNADLDCFGVYPTMIPLAFYYTFHMNINPRILHRVRRITQNEHVLLHSLNRHLSVAVF